MRRIAGYSYSNSWFKILECMSCYLSANDPSYLHVRMKSVFITFSTNMKSCKALDADPGMYSVFHILLDCVLKLFKFLIFPDWWNHLFPKFFPFQGNNDFFSLVSLFSTTSLE